MAKRFFSLKWKAFVYTSLLLILVFTVFTLTSGYFSHQRLLDLGRERTQRNVEQVDALLQRIAVRTQSLARTFVNVQGVADALQRRDRDALTASVQPYWDEIGADFALRSAVVFTPEDEALMWRGDPRIPPELLEKYHQDGQAHWMLACFDLCEIYVVTPLAFPGAGSDASARGMLVLSGSLQALVSRFQDLNRSRIAISVRRNTPPETRENSLDEWGSVIVSQLDQARDLPLLQAMARTYSRADVFNGVVLEADSKRFEFVLRPLRGAVFPRQGELLFVTDVTAEHVQYLAVRRSLNLFAIVGLVFAELILLSTLWSPLNRLRSIAGVLPQLATDSLGQIRRQLATLDRDHRYNDESDMLTDAALRLSHLLEDLQG